jgi:glutathione S-transferase
MAELLKILKPLQPRTLPFAPPFLRDGDTIIPHIADFLMYLAPKPGLVPKPEKTCHVANGLHLTFTDIVTTRRNS